MATTRIASGRTVPGSTAWQVYASNGIFLDVNTTAAHLTGTPVYVTSIGGTSSHWATTGATSIYFATATGFRVYVRWVDNAPITPATANGFQWHINWIAMEV
jgi:acetyl-CoA carboxylase carboxyltransferase component